MYRNNYTSIKAVKSWVKVYQVAIRLFMQNGFHNTSIRQITKEAGCSLGTFYRYFSTKEEVIFALYEEISHDLEHQLEEVPEGSYVDRFKWLLLKKIEKISPYKKLFKSIVGLMIDSDRKIGVTGKETEIIRLKNATIFKTLVTGSTDSPEIQKDIYELTNALYGIHLGLLFFWLLDKSEDGSSTINAIEKASELMELSQQFKPIETYLFGSLNDTFTSFLNLNTSEDDERTANQILNILFKHRKLTNLDSTCLTQPCLTCKTTHLDKIIHFVNKQEPIQLVLPAFPAKSPNTNKVLGTRSDLGEEIALQTLQELCNQIQTIYKPGAKISICADGRVFTDLVKITDGDVSNYIQDLKALIKQNNLNHIKLFNLEDFLDFEGDFNIAREKLLSTYSKDISFYQAAIKTQASYTRLFNGIHRFITEDQKDLYANWSKTKFKNHTKSIAIQVIQRSEAWGLFLSKFFPTAIRLSIHPHSAHSEKIGIKLTKAEDNWITPWHGVILLDSKEGYQLVKKSYAESLNAQLIYKEEQPYYYTLNHE